MLGLNYEALWLGITSSRFENKFKVYEIRVLF